MNSLESIKQSICVAFCNDLTIRKVPSGLAVSTGFSSSDGDSIGFYVVRSEVSPTQFRLEDSGTLIPTIEADGVNLHKGQRAELFGKLLAEYGVSYDRSACVLHTELMEPEGLAQASLRFLAMMLRLQDLDLLSPQNVANTFADDALQALHKRFADRAVVEANGIVSEQFPYYIADAIIRPADLDPVAVYFATSASKVDEAVILRMDANIKQQNLKVVLLLETLTPHGIPKRTLLRAHNVLDGLPVFEQRKESMDKIFSVTYANQVRTH